MYRSLIVLLLLPAALLCSGSAALAQGEGSTSQATKTDAGQSQTATDAAEAEVAAASDWIRDLFPDALTETPFLLPWYQWICLAIVIFAGMAIDAIVRFLLNRATDTWLKMRNVEVDRQRERTTGFCGSADPDGAIGRSGGLGLWRNV